MSLYFIVVAKENLSNKVLNHFSGGGKFTKIKRHLYYKARVEYIIEGGKEYFREP